MNDIFTNLLHASFHGSIIILLVIAARLILWKAPRSTICLLWVMAGLRLLLPFQIESPMSLQPEFPTLVSREQVDIPALPDIDPDSAVVSDQLPPDITIIYDNNAVAEPEIHIVNYDTIAAGIWAMAACGIVGYTIVSYGILKRKVRDAQVVEDGVLESGSIDSPFLLGYIKPAIFLPKGLDDADRPHILAHERGHMDRGDNWIKLIGFLCVALHWFNPLVWLGYHLLCKDIEMACDEHVVKYMDLDSRKGYSAALVNCSTTRRFGACPVAFGEISVKRRVLSVLHYRKPGFWISLACLLVVGVTATCFLTNPITPKKNDDQLQKCNDAVKMLQSADSYHLRIHFESNDPAILNDSYYHEHWCSGTDSLQSIWDRDVENLCLFAQGQYFRKTVSNAVPPEELYYVNWTAVEQPEIHFSGKPWIMNIQWDDAYVSILGSDLIEMEEVITVAVNDPEAEAPYQLTFRFDQESGKLNSVRMWHTYETAGTTYTSSATIESYSFDKTTIKARIHDQYEDAVGLSADGTELLQKCKDAYTRFFGGQTYEIQVNTKFTSNSNIMNYSTNTRFLRDGNDWYRYYTINEQAFTKTQAELSYEGNVFEFRTPVDSPTPDWSITNESSQLGAPWTVAIDWTNLVYHATDGASGSRGYSFLLNGDSDNIITFCFDVNGALTAITHSFILVTPMDTISHVRVECKLISNQQEEISAEILRNYLQAIVEPANGPTN